MSSYAYFHSQEDFDSFMTKWVSDNNKIYMTITAEGKLVPGDGLSDDEATQRIFSALQKMFSDHIKKIEKNNRDDMIKTLDNIERLLMNMEPHVPQACYPGKERLIDNYLEAIRFEIDAFKEGD